MKKLCLLAVVGLFFLGCATFQHSEFIDADHLGATGKYHHETQGPVGTFFLAGVGAGVSGSAGGGGAGAISVTTGFTAPDPRNFARSVSMINYSKKLKSVKYDEISGVRSYEFEDPHAVATKEPSLSTQEYPPSFGRQPIQ
jgi:hypothetical protein